MKKDKEWLKGEVSELYPSYDEMYVSPDYETVAKTETISKVLELIDQLDEQDKPVIPQFVADWIDAHNLHGNNPLREYRDLENDFNEGWTNEEDATVYHWANKNPYAFIDALRYGYEVEKEILWEIPMPDLKTSDGHIQYLTYDPKAKAYFTGRKNGRYRRYVELCDLKKIEEVTE